MNKVKDKARRNKRKVSKDSQDLEEMRESLSKSVFETFIKQFAVMLVESENLILDGKTDEEIRSETISIFNKQRKNDDFWNQFNFTVDHTDDFLERAKKEQENEDYKMAILIYAIYFEHVINLLVQNLSAKINLSLEDLDRIFRKNDMEDKCTWLLKIFTGESLNLSVVKKILKINKIRNEYVHYKWKSHNENENNQIRAVLENIDEIIAYLDNYRDKYTMGGHGKRIEKIFSKIGTG